MDMFCVDSRLRTDQFELRKRVKWIYIDQFASHKQAKTMKGRLNQRRGRSPNQAVDMEMVKNQIYVRTIHRTYVKGERQIDLSYNSKDTWT